MANELTRRPQQQSLVPFGEEWAAMKEQATVLLQGGFAGPSFKTPEQVIAVLLTAREMGIGYREALDNFTPINGRLTPSSSLQLAQAYRNVPGFTFELLQSNDKECTGRARRNGSGWITVTWTIEEAAAAGLTTKDNWRKFAKDMLFARMVGRLLNIVAPDALGGGKYSKEVAQDFEETPVVVGQPTPTSAPIDISGMTEIKDAEIITDNTTTNHNQEEPA